MAIKMIMQSLLQCIDCLFRSEHYCDVIMTPITFQITSLTIVYLNVYSSADQRKHHRSALLALVRGIHRWPVMRKMFPFDDVIMNMKFLDINNGHQATRFTRINFIVMLRLRKYAIRWNHSGPKSC